MSTYWGYICRTCNVASAHWHNHGDDVLVEFHHAWHALRDMELRLVGVATDSNWVDWDMAIFLEEHEGHDIALESEYNEVKDIPQRPPTKIRNTAPAPASTGRDPNR